MTKRVLSAILWFVACDWGYNYVALVLHVPALAGLLLAAGVSLLVAVDPWHKLWRTRATPPAPMAVAARPAPLASNQTL